ncbi:ABC transporter permease [Candidatus Raskinella chloraquaticus]
MTGLTMWQSLTLAARLALRDLRGGFQGLTVFVGCLAVGVAAIVTVDTIARGLNDSLQREGRSILGGDVSWSLSHREADGDEFAYFAGLGPVSRQATLRAMARVDGRQTLAEVKAVDDAYPLAGRLITAPPVAPSDLFAFRDGAFGAVAEAALLDKLGLAVGERLSLGGLSLQIRARLDGEPDKLAGGIGFGPRVMVSTDALRASQLLQPGSLVRWTYRIALPQASAARLKALADEARTHFPSAGWEARTRGNASQQLASNITRFTQFLDLVGLTALLVGGVGVANAVAAQIAARRPAIATLKALGASGGFAALTYLVQAGMVAGLGIAIGCVIGLALPFALITVFGDLLPLNVTLGIYPSGLVLAAFYGLMISFAFAVWSLGEAHDVPVQSLYRDDRQGGPVRPRAAYILAALAATIAVIAVATLTADDWRVPAIYAAAAIAAFVVLRLTARLVMWLAAAVPRYTFLPVRLALTSLYRPGAPTAAVVLSLGLGLTLLVALGLIDSNLRRQLTAALPERAPSFYFLDIRSSELPAFRAFLAKAAPDGKSDSVPLLRGRIVTLNGVPAEAVKASADAAWVLSGDRGLTTAETLPENARLVDGKWWSADESRPLVSFEEKVARGLGLKVGDQVTVNVLGRNIDAEIANTRTVQWETLGINFVMMFSPATFRGAPMSELATLTLPGSTKAADETVLLRQVGEAFPAVTVIRVKEALETINNLVAKLAIAVRGAASVAIIASLFVLAGAIASSHRARLFDAVILKTLGATRLTLVGALAVEFLLLGLVTAAIGILAGHGVAWMVVTKVMKVDFVGSAGLAMAIAGLSLAVTLSFGLAGAWSLLRQRPARLLRAI